MGSGIPARVGRLAVLSGLVALGACSRGFDPAQETLVDMCIPAPIAAEQPSRWPR